MKTIVASLVAMLVYSCSAPVHADTASVYEVEYTRHKANVPTPPRRPRGKAHAAGADKIAIVRAAAIRHGIPPAWYLAKVHTESRFNCSAVSPAGARGIGQVMPATARGMGYSPAAMFNCHTGADAGAKYAAMAYRAAGGNLMHASTLYLTGLYSGRTRSAYGQHVLSAMRNYN